MLCFCVLETFGGDSIIVIKLALHPVLLSILLTLKESKRMREEEGWSWIFTLLPSKSQAEMLLHSGHMSRSLNPPFSWILLHFLLVFPYVLGANATFLEHLDLLWRNALGCTVHKLRCLLCCQCCKLHTGQLLPWVVTGHLSWTMNYTQPTGHSFLELLHQRNNAKIKETDGVCSCEQLCPAQPVSPCL